MIHLYTIYHLNPSNHYWENEWKLSLSRVWRTDRQMDGRRTGRTSPHHNTFCFQRAYKNVNFVDKTHKFRWFSFQKTYSSCVKQVHFQVYFPSFIDTRYISISFCSTDGQSGAIICVKFNDFQAFLRKRQEKVLFMTSQCSQIRNSLQFFCSCILGIYLTFL
jgi:hypothetical protein